MFTYILANIVQMPLLNKIQNDHINYLTYMYCHLLLKETALPLVEKRVISKLFFYRMLSFFS